MNQAVSYLCLCLALLARAHPQMSDAPPPELLPRDIVNAASYSGGKLTPGEIVVLFPSHAGPIALTAPQLNSDGRVATSTGETRVLFDGIAAPMVYAVAGRIAAVVPYEIAGSKSVQVVVEYKGQISAPVTLPVVDSAPALFTLDATGKGEAAMLNETGCCNSVRNPALRGSIAALYATGEGQTAPAGIDGDLSGYPRIADLPRPLLPVSVTLGGVPAEIIYAGDAPHSVAGLLQVNFRVPPAAPLGDAVPLVLTVGNARSREDVTMAVRSEVRTVLVIDSDLDSRNRLTGILKGAGYGVYAARDGREARTLATQHPLDMLICSLAIPAADRMDTVRAISSDRRQLKIVATSEALGPATLRAADMLGAQAVLPKSMTSQALLQRLRELLRVRPMRYTVGDEESVSPLRLPR